MNKLKVYEKPTCTTCRKLAQLLIENGVEFERVNYYIKPFTKNKLKALLKKMEMKPHELLRKNEAAYKKLNIKVNNFSEDEILDLMIRNHDLVQRPIVEKGNKAVLARPAENVKKLF